MIIRALLTILLICSQLDVYAQRRIADIPLPKGYARVRCDGYGSYLRSLRLTGDKKIHTYNGRVINRSNTYAVLDIDVGNNNLQRVYPVQQYVDVARDEDGQSEGTKGGRLLCVCKRADIRSCGDDS